MPTRKSSTQQLKEFFETRQRKTYLIGIVTLITIALMLLLVILPAITSITDKISQNRERREYYDFLVRKERNITNYLNQKDSNLDQIENLNDAIPDGLNDEYIVANLEEMARSERTEVLRIDFQEPSKSTNPTSNSKLNIWERPFKVTISGRSRGLEETLKKIESFPTIISVDNLSFSNRNLDQNTSSNFILNLDLRYYYYNDGTN